MLMHVPLEGGLKALKITDFINIFQLVGIQISEQQNRNVLSVMVSQIPKTVGLAFHITWRKF